MNVDMEVDDAHLTLTADDDSCAMHAGQEVFMAVVSNSSTIGVAMYDTRDQSIGVCQAADSIGSSALFSRLGVVKTSRSARDSYAALQLIKGQVNPTYIFVSSKADEHTIEACERPLDSREADEEEGQTFEVRREKASAFNVANGLRMADMIRIRDDASGDDPTRRPPLLDSLVDLTKDLAVSALGALLFIMQRDGYGSNGAADDEDNESRMEINISAIFELPVQGCLQVDAATLRALSIFSLDDHPSKMGIGSSKEGFSLYSIISQRSWMARPLIDLGATRDRGDAIALFLHSSSVMEAFKGAMGGIKDIPKLLQLTSNSQMHPEAKVFKLMQQSMQQLLTLRGYLQELVAGDGSDPGRSLGVSTLGVGGSEGAEINQWQRLSISNKILNQVPRQALEDAVNLISDVVDFGSRGEEGGIIQRGVCEELDALKDEYGRSRGYGLGPRDYVDGSSERGPSYPHETNTRLPETLTSILQDELARIPPFLSRGNSTQLWAIIFLPQLGYVLQISGDPLTSDLMDELGDYEEIMRGHAADGAPSIYYRTDLTRELSDVLGDLNNKIGDLEGSLAIELIARLIALSPRLYGASMAIAELDCLMAFAGCARDYSWNRADLIIDNILEIKQGRHPLAELVASGSSFSFIPNDCKMEASEAPGQSEEGQGGEGKGRVQVITGPNASGKSVFIKQVALIAYLAHLGSFVPAVSARIGIIDRIFTRLVTTESPRLGTSSFMSDLSQVTSMVLKATDRSLCIIDEFGKGTLTADGIGLLAGILTHFCIGSGGQGVDGANSVTPRVLATTHFTELFDARVLERHPQLAFFTMNVMLQGAGDEDPRVRMEASKVVPLDAQPVFLFRHVPGYATPSFGIQCARACGVPRKVLERAQQLIQVQMEGQDPDAGN